MTDEDQPVLESVPEPLSLVEKLGLSEEEIAELKAELSSKPEAKPVEQPEESPPREEIRAENDEKAKEFWGKAHKERDGSLMVGPSSFDWFLCTECGTVAMTQAIPLDRNPIVPPRCPGCSRHGSELAYYGRSTLEVYAPEPIHEHRYNREPDLMLPTDPPQMLFKCIEEDCDNTLTLNQSQVDQLRSSQ